MKRRSDDSVHIRRASEKTKKRMKMADLKTFVETKLLSKSDKALEKIGQDEHKLLGEHAVGSRNIINVCILSYHFRRILCILFRNLKKLFEIYIINALNKSFQLAFYSVWFSLNVNYIFFN